MKVNTFFYKTRRSEPLPVEPSITVPDQAINLADIIRSGKLEEAGEHIRSRMIFGKKERIEDLTAIDYYKKRLAIHKNIIRTSEAERSEAERTTIEEKNSTVEKLDSAKNSQSKTD